jgi:hypothetical protein
VNVRDIVSLLQEQAPGRVKDDGGGNLSSFREEVVTVSSLSAQAFEKRTSQPGSN